ASGGPALAARAWPTLLFLLRLLRLGQVYVVEAKHVGSDRLGVRADDFDRQLVRAGFQVLRAERHGAGGDDRRRIEKVDWPAQRLAVERELHDAVVAGFGERGQDVVAAGLLDRQPQCEVA